MNRSIDHIVYCVPNLEKAVNEMHSLLGVQLSIGGRHLKNGTRNALLNIGDACYLELLAKDQENLPFKDKRWMGIDLIDSPKITRWSLKSEDLNTDCQVLKSYDHALASIFSGSRKTTDNSLLKWKMSLPLPEPEIELAPFFTDWSESAYHPTDRLPQQCELLDLELFHPNPSSIRAVLKKLGAEINVFESPEIKIQITLKTPTGTHTLS